MVYYEESKSFSSNNNDWILATTEESSLDNNQQVVALDEGAESDYSLDYEYLGPRKPNYRTEIDNDSDASELSSCNEQEQEGFDMWDEDPYSTNDFTWESNDMRLTSFIKERKKQLKKLNSIAPWKTSFYRKEKGWPKQLPCSSSTTNHDQSANALSLILSDYGLTEKLHTVYRDRIIECGTTSMHCLDQEENTTITTAEEEEENTITTLDHDVQIHSQDYVSSTNKFIETHASISLPTLKQQQQQQQQQLLNQQQINNNTTTMNTTTTTNTTVNNNKNFISNFTPYTKFIQRSQFPVIFPQDAYLALGFEPLCLVEKYGYMAIGGIDGEFELYCCMNSTNKPLKIWGTKFKGKNNVLLMTNAVQIVRYKSTNDYEYYLIACMNDAGVLVYHLPSHNQCHPTKASCHLYCHIKCFDHVPINDARVSPNGQHLICVGDDACIFYLTVTFNNYRLIFGTPQKYKIPFTILIQSDSLTFSSQYVAWSKSSTFFAHTSDTHRTVLVWRTTPTLEMMYRIDAGGYTYAIQFHPEQEGVLAFSNRYGYIHTVNLDEAITQEDPTHIIRITKQKSIHHTVHLFARHEITMISFRGEKDKRLRILAKINGLQWSKDGCYLYVSTKKRVLAYEFLQSSSHIKSLEKMAGLKALSILEQEEDRKRSRQENDSVKEKKKRKRWTEQWSAIPAHVRYNVLGDNTQLASHW